MFNCGEKFSFKNVVVDIEIIGVFPASQTKDRITEYVALFTEKHNAKKALTVVRELTDLLFYGE